MCLRRRDGVLLARSHARWVESVASMDTPCYVPAMHGVAAGEARRVMGTVPAMPVVLLHRLADSRLEITTLFGDVADESLLPARGIGVGSCRVAVK